MRRLLKLLKVPSFDSKGFTLIELLVVIGILGILATALVATIDPFEQLKKAQDANTKNALVEYINANVRYYTTHSTFPWDTVANGGAACNTATAPDGTKALNDSTGNNITTCTTALINDKELKSGFSTATSVLKEIYLNYTVASNTLTACFKPQSASQQRDLSVIYKADGTDDSATCLTAGARNAVQCYWCTK